MTHIPTKKKCVFTQGRVMLDKEAASRLIPPMDLRAAFRHTKPLLIFAAIIWVIEGVQQLTGHPFNAWLGLEPRSTGGLIGIPAMPLLHGNLAHVLANTPPLIILGAMTMAVAPKRFFSVSVTIVLISGLAVWMTGRPNTIHIGASGLIFGWFGFLLALGWFERGTRAILGALAVLAIYSGMFWGLLPADAERVSWEAHLFGALAGAIAAWLFRERPPANA